MKRSELFFSVLLIPIDFCMLLAGFALAYYVRGNGYVFSPDIPGQFGRVIRYGVLGEIMPFPAYMHYVLYIVPVMILIFAFTGLYAMRGSFGWWRSLVRVFIGVSVGLFFILLLFLLRQDFFLPRATVLYAWGLCTLSVLFGRVCIRAIQRSLRPLGIGVVRVAIIGKSTAAEQIMVNLHRNPHSLYRLDARYDSLEVDNIITQLEADKIDELIVVNEHYDAKELITLRNHCLENQVTFSFVPALFAELPSSYDIRTEVGLPMIEVRPTPLEGWGRVLKRLFDVIVSFILIILCSPLFLFIAIWLILASPGPLIYQQERIGRGLKPIKIWKFRTMHIQYCTGMGYDGDAYFAKLLQDNPDLAEEWQQYTKLKNDPRISRPGRFLRATSLDELPQFFNVLTGVLSLVGPRPIVKEEIRKYGETARILFTVKPGVTGLWQVSGRNDVSFKERVALDAQYIEQWSIWKDIGIMLKTVIVLIPVKGRGY